MKDCEHNWVFLKEVDISFKGIDSSEINESNGFIFYCSKCLAFQVKPIGNLNVRR